MQALNAWLKVSGIEGFVVARNFAYLSGDKIKKWIPFVGYQIFASTAHYWGSVAHRLKLTIPKNSTVVQEIGPYNFEAFYEHSDFRGETHLMDEKLFTSGESVIIDGVPVDTSYDGVSGQPWAEILKPITTRIHGSTLSAETDQSLQLVFECFKLSIKRFKFIFYLEAMVIHYRYISRPTLSTTDLHISRNFCNVRRNSNTSMVNRCRNLTSPALEAVRRPRVR